MDLAVSAAIRAVAEELAQKAKNSLPELREGEKVQREWFIDGVYCRETSLGGATYLGQYDFRQKVADFAAAS